MTTPDLTELVKIWVRDYSKINPGTIFSVSTSLTQEIASVSSLSVISGEPSIVGREKSWKLMLAHDAVVPFFNSKNPCMDKILAGGISSSGFGRIVQGSGKIFWSEVIQGGPEKPITLYLPDNSTVQKNINAFTGSDVSSQHAVKIVTEEKITGSVLDDVYAVGFCRLNDIQITGTSSLPPGISIIPVDRNGNGRIDNFEKIYDSPKSLLRGAWTGKYPHSLSGSIYAVAAGKPRDKNTLEFLKWVISGGDQLLSSAGFSQLAGSEKETGLTALAESVTNVVIPANRSVSYSWLFIITTVVVIAGLVSALLRSRRKKSSFISTHREKEIQILNESAVTSPGGLLFDKSHTWAYMERDGLVRIGVDDFLQHVTGAITGVRLMEPGDAVRRGEKMLTIIRDGKQLNLYAPVTGIIRSLNTDLYLDSSIINSSPYSDGWVYLIEPKNWLREISMMYHNERFREWIRDEFARLKDFIAATLKSHYPAYEQVVLQDGGELTDNPLEKLGPEVWEDFQTNFIDKSR
jgi:glycine cleavage system H lipoate-binding protein